jgi:hypothetical protein
MKKTTIINLIYSVIVSLSLLIGASLVSSCSCSFIQYSDINDYKGSVILGMEKDTAVTTIMYNVDVITKEGRYETLILRQRVGERYKTGDTIK